MHLILGGKFMGKQSYAERIYQHFNTAYDVALQEPDEIAKSGLIVNIHMGVKKLLARDINSVEFFRAKLEILRHSVIIGDEISGGVIPVDEFERHWRDETGKLYQFLASEAEIVDRVFAGLALRLKG